MSGLDKLHTYKLTQILYQARVDAGLTQQNIGEALGVHYNFITKMESGDRQLTLFDFIAYCNFL